MEIHLDFYNGQKDEHTCLSCGGRAVGLLCRASHGFCRIYIYIVADSSPIRWRPFFIWVGCSSLPLAIPLTMPPFITHGSLVSGACLGYTERIHQAQTLRLRRFTRNAMATKLSSLSTCA